MGHSGPVGEAKSPDDVNSERLHLILGTGLLNSLVCLRERDSVYWSSDL